jgi:hypothetical protein
VSDYLTQSDLEALDYALADLPPTNLVALDGSPCWERSALTDFLDMPDREEGCAP